MLIAAGAVAYLGAFTSSFRQQLVDSFLQLCSKAVSGIIVLMVLLRCSEAALTIQVQQLTCCHAATMKMFAVYVCIVSSAYGIGLLRQQECTQGCFLSVLMRTAEPAAHCQVLALFSAG